MINEVINYKIIQLEKNKKIVFYVLTGILMSLLLILYLYHNNAYGFFALILLVGLIIIMITGVYLTMEYFKIIRDIRYNEFILLELEQN